MGAKYKEPHKVKQFDFAKYQTGIVGEDIKQKHSNRFNPKEIDFDDFAGDNEIDPIQTDVTDAGALFNSEDAIVYDINKKSE